MRPIHSMLVASLVAMTATATLGAQDLAKKVQDEYQQAYDAYLAKSRAHRGGDRTKLRELRPKAEDYAARLIALAKTDEQSDAAFEGLSWAAQVGRSSEAVQLILDHHGARKELAPIVKKLGRKHSAKEDAALKSLLAKNPHREVKAHAAYWLGYSMKYRADPEAVRYYKLVIEEYADVKDGRGTLAQKAKKDLKEAMTLGRGATAPDIAAADTDGVDFKLSDYRGKVVVLNFWGHW